MPPPPAPSTGGGLCITFINKGTPIFYAYEPNGTITLTDHSGQPIRSNGKMFQARLDRGESADEVAQALWHESRGESTITSTVRFCIAIRRCRYERETNKRIASPVQCIKMF
jgi:hypothetical protein